MECHHRMHMQLRMKGVSQRDLAERLGVSETTISLKLTGKRPLSEDFIKKIEQALDANNQTENSEGDTNDEKK